MRGKGIYTALDLRNVDPRWARQRYTVVGERLVRELNGLSCLSLEDVLAPRKSIQVGRSFSQPVRCLQEMEQAVTTYVSRLGAKLRRLGLYTYGLRVFMRNSPYHQNFQYLTIDYHLDHPINNTQALIHVALFLTRKLFKPGQQYHKAGVMAYP